MMARKPKAAYDDVAKLARTYTAEAVEALVDALKATRIVGGRNPIKYDDHATRVTAANALLDRGHGRAVPATEHTSNTEKAHLLTLQARKLEAETKLLESKIKDDGPSDDDYIPGTEEYSDYLRREWGYDRSGLKAKDADEADDSGVSAGVARDQLRRLSTKVDH